MSTQFDYTYSNFIDGINIEKMRCEIQMILINQANEFYISAHGNNVSIFFEIGLSVGEISDLNTVINVHDAGIPIIDDCISPENYPNLVVDNITVTGNNTSGNVNFIDVVTIIKNDVDNPKQFRFQADSITSNTLREFIVPDADTTLVGTDVPQVLTNKTLTDNSNNIISREMWVENGTLSVSTYDADAPTNGQALIATSSTTAEWQDLPINEGSTIIVEDEGGNVTSTPHSILNFTGLGVNASNEGSNTANINVPGFVLNTLTPQEQFLATSMDGNEFSITSTGNVHTFNLPEASLTANGIVTTYRNAVV